MTREISGEARTIVITGGTSGLGRAAAAALLTSPDGPWHVVLPARDAGRGQDAVDALAADAAPGHTVETMPLDLASLASVRAFATELTRRTESGQTPRPHALVCNAGVQMGATLAHTVDGFESTFGVNHLGHFTLVNSLLPILRAPARIVMTTSDTHDPALRLSPPPAWSGATALARGELAPSAGSDSGLVLGQRRYSTSKLANIYFTYALARRLPAGVTVNAFNPGMVLGTGLGRSLPSPMRFVANHVAPRATWLLRRVVTPNIHSAAESGGALAWLVTAAELDGTSGAYFDGRRQISSSQESYDVRRSEGLWTDSAELTGVDA